MSRRQLLSTQNLAAYLQVPIQTIYRWRSCGEGPPGIRVGRHIRYRVDDVEAWLASRTSTPGRAS
ncbi:MAG: helix-turn-helix domain-containing protein [Actinomycetota bacterium]|nr:helix-turn-helix domain-containing protein [Actinomycetota bacterium]